MNILSQVFCALSPLFALVRAFMIINDFLNIRSGLTTREIIDGEIVVTEANIHSWSLLGMSAAYLAGHAVFWSLILLVADAKPEIAGFFRGMKKCIRSRSELIVVEN